MGIFFADSPHKIGDCRVPICVGPKAASQLFARWNSIAKNNRPLASDDPALEEYFGIAPHNVHRARIRLTIEAYRGQMGSESEPRDAAGYLINEPSSE